MEEMLRSNLFAVAGAYAESQNLKMHAVAALAARDAGFFSRIKKPQTSFTIRKYDDVMQWFSDHWPRERAWPSGVVRPSAKMATA